MDTKQLLEFAKEIRKETGAPIKLCYDSIIETKGDKVEAKKIVRSQMAEKMEKTASEQKTSDIGLVGILKKDKTVLLGKINTESDLIGDIITETLETVLIHTMNCNYGQEKILEDINNDDHNKTVLTEARTKSRELISITQAELSHAEGEWVYYVHNSEKTFQNEELTCVIGGFIAAVDIICHEEHSSEIGKKVAMHICSEKPEFLSRETISAEEHKKIEEQISEEMKQFPKEKFSEEKLAMIFKNKLNSYFLEHTLLEQKFVHDTSITVAEFLKSKDAEIKKFLTISSK